MRRGVWGNLVAGVMAALLTGGLVLAPAAAVDPMRLPDQVTDHVQALGSRTTEVTAAIDRLEREHQVRMWVVFVDSFDGVDAQRWADATFRATELGGRDYLLAVAMTDRKYGYVVANDFVLDDAALMRVSIALQEHLADDPAQAVIEAAVSIADNLTGTSAPFSPQRPPFDIPGEVLLIGLVIVLVAGYSIVRGVRRVRQGLPFFEPREGGSSDSSWADSWSVGTSWSDSGNWSDSGSSSDSGSWSDSGSGGSGGGADSDGTRGGGGTF